MWKHCVRHHNSERQYFRMKVKDQVRNDATKRQILESVRIERTEEGERMNSRGNGGGGEQEAPAGNSCTYSTAASMFELQKIPLIPATTHS